MRKIITISVGQSGNQVAIDYWKKLCAEAEINYLGSASKRDLHYLPYYFKERNEQYIPNAIFIDTDPTVLDNLQTSEMKGLFSQDSYVSKLIPSQGIFQQPKDEEANDSLMSQIIEAVRKQAEEADYLQGIQLMLGSSGGAGSGIGSFLSTHLKQQYSTKEAFISILFPTLLNCRSPLDLYNTILLFPSLECQLCFAFDNEALQSTCFNTFFDQAPDHNSMNSLMSQAILGTTQSLRSPGKINTSFAKISHTMLPFYKYNFIALNQAPLVNSCENLTELCNQLFNEKQQFFTYDPKDGQYLVCQLLLKGNISLPEIDQVIYNTVPKNSFVDWLPDNIQKTLCSEYGELSAQLLSNSTGIKKAFIKLLDETKQIFAKKQYFNVYENMGIEELQMKNTIYKLEQLLSPDF